MSHFLKNASFFCRVSDSIEANVGNAAAHVEQGNVQLEKARDYQASYHTVFIGIARDAGAIAVQGGPTGNEKTLEGHIQEIFIVLFPNHVLLILLGTDFVLIRE